MARNSEFEYASYNDFRLPDVDSAECQAKLLNDLWLRQKITFTKMYTHEKGISNKIEEKLLA